jgi:sugar/nucleoside kinase (ribokinase family)
MKVLVIGDLSVSVAAETPRLPRPGENLILGNPSLLPSGVAANISFDLRGLGVETYVSGVVGRDVFGGVVVRELTSWGVHTRYIGMSPRPTSIFLVIVDGDGERTMIGYRGASEALRLDRQLIEEIEPDWVHVSGYTLLNRGQEKALGPFIKAATSKGFVSLDLEGVAYSARSLPLEGAYVFCNLDEYHAYFKTKEVAPHSHPFTILLKAGPGGSYLITRGGLRRFRAFKTKVRDTNGAGDAFNAGFIYARLSGFSEEEACVWGNACASLKVSRSGPHPRIGKKRVEALVRGRVRRLSSRRGGRCPPRPG